MQARDEARLVDLVPAAGAVGKADDVRAFLLEAGGKCQALRHYREAAVIGRTRRRVVQYRNRVWGGPLPASPRVIRDAMPELVACPACGCRVQMADSTIGRPVRCISCDHRFTASSPAEVETRRVGPLPPVEPPPAPERGPPHRRPAGEPDEDHRPPPGAGRPCCPRCGRPVDWEAFRCASCGEQLEFDGGCRRFRWPGLPPRRDAEPHRGPLLSGLGTVALAAGGLTLCLAGAPLLVVLPLGVTTWVMASNDLKKMRTGEMDPEGRGATESARASAVIGMVLGVFFAAVWGLLALSHMFP